MKTLIAKVQHLLSNSTWTTEYCYPETWSTADIDKCRNKLERTNFKLTLVSSLMDEHFTDILLAWEESEMEHSEFHVAAANYIADMVAKDLLHKRSDVYYPESATFSIILP